MPPKKKKTPKATKKSGGARSTRSTRSGTGSLPPSPEVEDGEIEDHESTDEETAATGSLPSDQSNLMVTLLKGLEKRMEKKSTLLKCNYSHLGEPQIW